MGRRTKRARKLERRRPTRISSRSILIVCEDSKSSPGYFRNFRKKLNLGSVAVEVAGKECGSAPRSVVDYAIEKKRAASKSTIQSEYDEIYCVIDIDRHKSLAEALDTAHANDLIIILSNPCFEYWYILHFEKTGQAFYHHRDVVKKLKSYYPKYDKAKSDIFDTIYPKTDKAIARSKHILHAQHHDEEDLRKCHPSTHVHRVVETIKQIADT